MKKCAAHHGPIKQGENKPVIMFCSFRYTRYVFVQAGLYGFDFMQTMGMGRVET